MPVDESLHFMLTFNRPYLECTILKHELEGLMLVVAYIVGTL